MSTYQWRYANSFPHKIITLYHGPKTGHVLITLDNTILIIDFLVRKSKSYSFFIGEELCEVRIERKNNKYHYAFQINTEAKTPLNQKRKQQQKLHFKKSILIFGISILFIILLSLFIKLQKDKKSQKLRGRTLATIQKIDADHITIQHNIPQLHPGTYLLPATYPPQYNFPLLVGDQFIIVYNPQKPSNNQILFNQPSKKVEKRYFQLTTEVTKYVNPSLTLSSIQCYLNAVFKSEGTHGLAKVFHQNKTKKQNPVHNQLTYQHTYTRYQKYLTDPCPIK